MDLIWLFENVDRNIDWIPNKFMDKQNLYNLRLSFEREENMSILKESVNEC